MWLYFDHIKRQILQKDDYFGHISVDGSVKNMYVLLSFNFVS